MSHVTIAASANAFTQLFNAVRNNFSVPASDNGSFGPFTWSYSIKIHLENGSIQLNNDGTVEITNLDVVFDTLQFSLCFDFPGFCVGGFCIVPDPWNGCLVGLPQICIGGPVCLPLDLSGLVSKITDVKASLLAKYFVDPGRLASWTDLDAEVNGKPNQWQIYIDPTLVLVDPIDLPATIENIFDNAVNKIIDDFINNVTGGLPPGIKEAIAALLNAARSVLIDLVNTALEIGGSITDFIQNLLDNIFNLLGFIETAVADYFASQYPIWHFEDPYPMLTGGPLIPVKIPIRNLTATVNTQEMVVLADVG